MTYEAVNRLEIVDETGRAYCNYYVEGMTFSVQDDGKTLKIFVKSGETICYSKDQIDK